ncbi:NACHT domain-containing protein [uncultured Flavobacterium sp.]|uniref:NACHT domain-containing protein n=1 Tax=uncultured Flavobacterium sp. TaxID=165435 RepID=UPI0030EF40AE
MIDWETIKKRIFEETKKVFNYKNDNNLIDLIQLFELCLSVKLNKTDLKLDGIESRISNALQIILVDEVGKEKKISLFADFAKIEPFFRKVLYLVNPSKYEKYDQGTKGLSALIGALSLNPRNIDFTSYDEQELKGNNIKDYHLLKVYNLRNIESHLCEDWTSKELYENIENLLVVYILVLERWKIELTEIINNDNLQKEQDFKPYLNSVKEDFKSRIGRFVHIKGKEDIRLSQNLVIENGINTDDNDRLERKGTVNELRRSNVPEKRMLIWGDAGMGKSTTLEYLAYYDADKKLKDSLNNTPVYISLGLLTDKSISIKTAIFTKIGVDEILGERMLVEGRINLFLDAINEIPRDDSNQLKTIRLREIQNLIKSYEKCFIILSNRPQDDNIFKEVPVFQLQKMDIDQIENFLNKNTESKADAQVILKNIKEDVRLEKIIKVPLMLSRLIEIYKVSGEIPKSEGEIIDKFIHSLYHREIEEKKDGNFHIRTIHTLLRYLGYWSLEKKDTNSGMTENEVINYFLECKNKYGFTIDVIYVLEIVTQLGILEKRDNLYTFAHQAYQDYFHSQEEIAIVGL